MPGENLHHVASIFIMKAVTSSGKEWIISILDAAFVIVDQLFP